MRSINWKVLAVVLIFITTCISASANTTAAKKPVGKAKVSVKSTKKPASKTANKTQAKKKVTVTKTENVKAKTKTKDKTPKTLPKLLDLGSDKCIPCKMMVSILDELTKENKGKLDVEFVDVWKNREIGEKYKIQSIPTQIFFDSKGKEIFRHAGYFPKKDIIDKFKELGIDISK